MEQKADNLNHHNRVKYVHALKGPSIRVKHVVQDYSYDLETSIVLGDLGGSWVLAQKDENVRDEEEKEDLRDEKDHVQNHSSISVRSRQVMLISSERLRH